MCNKIVSNILGKNTDVSKNRIEEGYEQSVYGINAKGEKITYLKNKKTKKTPTSVIEDINKKFKTN